MNNLFQLEAPVTHEYGARRLREIKRSIEKMCETEIDGTRKRCETRRVMNTVSQNAKPVTQAHSQSDWKFELNEYDAQESDFDPVEAAQHLEDERQSRIDFEVDCWRDEQ